MSWHIGSTRIEVGGVFLLDWFAGIQLQIPCIGFGVWVGKFSDAGPWQVVCEAVQ